MVGSKIKFLFFTGKGGVGKTTVACATAVQLADYGKRVLIVSTDPASNLDDVLESTITDEISSVKNMNGLFAININPDIAAKEYRSRVITPLQDKLTKDEILKLTEELSGACTTEIASFDEFSRFISEEGVEEKYDVVIFDTAPTGHTLRLLELPAAWSEFIEKNPAGASCLGPSSALKNNETRYKKVVSTLRDAAQTTFYILARAENSTLKEAARTSNELGELGMTNQKLIINGVFSAIDKSDLIAAKIESQAKNQLNKIPETLKKLECTMYPLLPYNILGLEKIRSLFNPDLQKKIIATFPISNKKELAKLPDLNELINSITKSKTSGLIMTMGKGGVGKTIVAAAIATILAQRGFEVLLSTTDPAAHVNYFMNQLKEVPANLLIEHIDPKTETEKYVEKIFLDKSKNLNDEEKKLLREDLKSPCNEEVAVFHAFSKVIQKAKRKFVVLDTAPTGHTLLLLDTAGSYHREILKNTNLNPDRITTPFMYLQDQDFAKIILVTLPETTPMHEATSLENDLKRAGITTYAWVINQSLSALQNLKDPILNRRAENEEVIIEKIKEDHLTKTYTIPFLVDENLLPALINSL